MWEEIQVYQEKKLKEKKISHKNFGDYSKDNCGMEKCSLNGLMIRQGSAISEGCISFKSDKKKTLKIIKSKKNKKNRKDINKLIKEDLSFY